jgi:hypothetical protein
MSRFLNIIDSERVDMDQFTIIGDVHGKYDEYVELIRSLPEDAQSIQIGDFGFEYDVFEKENIGFNHRFFGGNHDNYDKIRDCANAVLDFGQLGDDGNIFFVRGAFSIDRYIRTIGVDWWPNEELSFLMAHHVFRAYR